MRTPTFSVLDPNLSAAGTYVGKTIPGTLGGTLAFGDLCYLDPAASTWKAADANSAAAAAGDPRAMIGMCLIAGASGAPSLFLLEGTIRADSKFPTFTVNTPIYISETAGLVTGTQPSTADVVIRVLGFAITTHAMYFNPSGDYITHT